VVAFLLYLYYLLENSILTPSSSLLEFFLKWAIPFFFTLILVIAVAVEVLYYLRVRKTIGFHMKRFGMKLLLSFLLLLPFFGLFELLSSTLTPFVGYRLSAVLPTLRSAHCCNYLQVPTCYSTDLERTVTEKISHDIFIVPLGVYQ